MNELDTEPQDLQISISQLESLKVKTNWQIAPIIDLYTAYQRKPDLAAPIIIAGIKNVSEQGELMTSATPDHCKAILAAQEPLSPELAAATSHLIAKSAERLIAKLNAGESFADSGLISSKELVESDFATASIKQSKVRKAYGEWAEYHIRPNTRAGRNMPYQEFSLGQVVKEIYPEDF